MSGWASARRETYEIRPCLNQAGNENYLLTLGVRYKEKAREGIALNSVGARGTTENKRTDLPSDDKCLQV